MKRGLTFIEVLAVTGIILALLSIGWITSQSVRDRAHYERCASQLRQLSLAISIYRDEFDGASRSGTLYEMGLPPFPLRKSLPVSSTFRCQRIPNILYKNRRAFPYYYFPVRPEIDATIPTWAEYSRQYGEHAILLGDINHNSDQRALVSPNMSKTAIGISLDHTLVRPRKAGDWRNKDWWDRE